MLDSATIKLLRLPFSIFLTPIFFFGLSQVDRIDVGHAILIFVILHLLVYPASNGYNSYMDRDTGPIGGLEKPPMPSRQLYYVTIVLDLAAIGLGFLISPVFGLAMPIYIGASKAYSYRGIRLKKYPVTGYLLVILVQGAFTFWLVWYGSHAQGTSGLFDRTPWQEMITCAFLLGGFYPLTQIYQHRQDSEDGVRTISYMLGYRGTFIFCGIMYAVAWAIMAQFFMRIEQQTRLWVISLFFVPVIIYFIYWFSMVWKDPGEATFANTMRMTWLASGCTNLAFIILLTWRFFD